MQEHWVEWPDVVYDKAGNILLSRIMDADVWLDPAGFDIGIRPSWEEALTSVQERGGKPYAIPAGAFAFLDRFSLSARHSCCSGCVRPASQAADVRRVDSVSLSAPRWYRRSFGLAIQDKVRPERFLSKSLDGGSWDEMMATVAVLTGRRTVEQVDHRRQEVLRDG